MFIRYMLVGLGHFVTVALTLKVLNFILPCFVTCYYTCVANFVMCVIAARLTFRFSKRKFLGERIQPHNKAVLITGCDSGFGHGLAKQLDSRGFHVFASCLFPSGPGADDLKRSCSKRLQILGLDVTKDDSVKAAVEFLKANLGKCELWSIVNNAGVLKGFSTEVTDIQDFKDSMDVNAFGAVRVSKAFLPMLKQSKGRVVNLTSLAGKTGVAHFCPYTMSKFAAMGFSECLRRELFVWGVKVITVEPEGFQTAMTKAENMMSLISGYERDMASTYGAEYLKKFKKFIVDCDQFSSSKVFRVLDDLERAVSLENPDVSYNPCRNTFFEEGLNFTLMLPKVVQDVVSVFMNYLIGLPTPELQQ